MAPQQSKYEALAKLYEEIWQWGISKDDPLLAHRVVEAVDIDSDLFIVGEAHAKSQVRLTGVNWFDANGAMGDSGKNLEEILNCVGYSVRPHSDVTIGRYHVTRCDPQYNTVYTTDIFPCYPSNKKTPLTSELKDAMEQEFLIREMNIVCPKVIILLGSKSYKTFYKYLLNEPGIPKITEFFESLSPSTQLRQYRSTIVIPFFHTSGSNNGRFGLWKSDAGSALCEQPQVKAIRCALTQ